MDSDYMCRGQLFSSSPLQHSVHQGSVLGPVLFVQYASPVSDVISGHAMLHESLTNDIQLHLSAPIIKIDSLIFQGQAYIADLRDWVTSTNKLQVNDDKAEELMFTTKQPNHPYLP